MRWFALGVALAEFSIAYAQDGARSAVLLLWYIGLGLGCIWYSDVFGGLLGRDRTGAQRFEVPPKLTITLGWLVLCLPAMCWVIERLASGRAFFLR